jgi:cysteine desulfurase
MIYADYNGSAPLCSDVKEYLLTRLSEGPFANPNAIHSLGQKVNLGMEKCRKVCAEILGANSRQIIFNSGASEGISHIFHSILANKKTDKKNIIITSGIEHSAVVNNCEYYKTLGHQVLTVTTKANGEIDINHLKQLLEQNAANLALVTIMAANNETGVIQPYQAIGQLCQKYHVPYFSDTTQLIGKMKFNFAQAEMDYAVLSGHKIGALIGSGLILAKEASALTPFIFGGGQERGLRGGTQNFIGAETIAVALKSFEKAQDHIPKAHELRVAFEKAIQTEFPETVIVGQDADRLATTTLIAYPGIHGQAVQIELESQNIFVTTSSACSDNEPNTSKVLKAMQVNDSVGRGVIRISFCCGTSPENYQLTLKALSNAYKKLAKIKSF